MLNKLDKNINAYHFVVRTIGSLIVYIGLIVVIIYPKGIFGSDIIKPMLIGFFSVVALLFLIFNFVLPFFIHSLYGYRIHESYILVQRGVLFKTTEYIPLKRIQHIERLQGPIQTLFKQSTVFIHTAGSRDAIVGLPQDVANDVIHQIREKLQEYLDSCEGKTDES
ncbi:MAG: PH domain-containing protein [Firmicutes bacterium]|nr:PH domain-containing protein [Bacillota bacterium]